MQWITGIFTGIFNALLIIKAISVICGMYLLALLLNKKLPKRRK